MVNGMMRQEVRAQKGFHVLIVEDDQDLLQLLTDSLERRNYLVTGIVSASLITMAFGETDFDLIILDFLMPDSDGYDTLKKVRGLSKAPIMILTSLKTKETLSQCLALGADDYVTKPFNFEELFARIEAALRLSYPNLMSSFSAVPDGARYPVLIHNPQGVLVDGVHVALTTQEYEFLCYFFNNPNQVICPQQLLVDVWGREEYSPSTITNVVGRIRRKIEVDPADPQCLITVRGRGYMLKL